MNKDDDLIRRGDVRKMKFASYKIGADGIYVSVHDIIDNINAVPAAPQPMSAVEYLRTCTRRLKWCSVRPCYKCEYYDDCAMEHVGTPKYKVAIIEKWAKEHPEEVNNEID